jgi:hypothetical protein
MDFLITFSFAASRLFGFLVVSRGLPSVAHGYSPTPLRG